MLYRDCVIGRGGNQIRVSHILEENLDYSALEQEDQGGAIVCRAKLKKCSLGTHNEPDFAGKKCRGTL